MKKILVIDTRYADKATVVIKLDKKNYSKTVKKQLKSQVVLSLIDKVLKENKINIHELNAVEVFQGPGSFTGLRVGVAIANAMGAALDIPVNGKKQLVEPTYK